MIAAQKVHARVGARRIALQHLFDQADRLDVLLPVERRAQAQARDRVGDRDLRNALTLDVRRESCPRLSCAASAS